MMSLNGSNAKLISQAFSEFVGAVDDLKKNKAAREEAMAKGLRAISGGEFATKNLFFDSWGKVMVEGRGQRMLEKAEQQAKEMMIKAKAQKIQAVAKSLASKDKFL